MDKHTAHQRMIDSPEAPDEVRELLRAGIDDEVTDYDFEKGLATHLAAVVALPAATAATASSATSSAATSTASKLSLWKLASLKAGSTKALLAWIAVPVATIATVTGLWVASEESADPGVAPSAKPPETRAPAIVAPDDSTSEADEAAPPADKDDPTVGAAIPTGEADQADPIEAAPAPTADSAAPQTARKVARAKRATRRTPKGAKQRTAAAATQGAEQDTTGAAVDSTVDDSTVRESDIGGTALRERAVQERAVQKPTAAEIAAAEAAREAERRAQEEEKRRREARLQRDMALLVEAKQALNDHPARALALARQGEREFGDSLFSEERQHVLILALIKTGQLEEAKQKAEPFLRRYPNSPFAHRVEQALRKASR